MAARLAFHRLIDGIITRAIWSYLGNPFTVNTIEQALRHEEPIATLLSNVQRIPYGRSVHQVLMRQIRQRIRVLAQHKMTVQLPSGERDRVPIYANYKEGNRNYYQRVRGGISVSHLRVSEQRHRQLGARHNRIADVYHQLVTRAEARAESRITESIYDEVLQQV